MGESSVMTWALRFIYGREQCNNLGTVRFIYGREQCNDLGTEVCIWERAV